METQEYLVKFKNTFYQAWYKRQRWGTRTLFPLYDIIIIIIDDDDNNNDDDDDNNDNNNNNNNNNDYDDNTERLSLCRLTAGE